MSEKATDRVVELEEFIQRANNAVMILNNCKCFILWFFSLIFSYLESFGKMIRADEPQTEICPICL